MRLAQMLICLLIQPLAISVATAGDESVSISRQQSQDQQPASGSATTFKDFERQPTALSEREFQELKNRVASRCNVSPDTDPAKLPWYFHYELGLELAKKGDPQRAVDALIEAVDRRPEPKKNTRMYGMWFTDYLPYFEIAKAHAALGNWQCATDALRLSEGKREIQPQDQFFDELQELKTEAAAHEKP
jgi:hypothetical protein